MQQKYKLGRPLSYELTYINLLHTQCQKPGRSLGAIMADCHMELLHGLLHTKLLHPEHLAMQYQLIRHDAYKATKHFLMAIKNHSKC